MKRYFNKIVFTLALMGTIISSSLTLLMISHIVEAAELTRTTVTLTAQMISESSNTTIRFRTPTGVDASTDTITIRWPSGFNVSSIVLTDMDLSHGAVSGYETEDTLAATAAAGVWGAAWAGQVLTLTAPTDAAPGEVGVNDYIVLEVGTHASTGGAGSNQVVNPGTQASYNYIIGGTFGDTKTPAVWIADDNTVGITGLVPGGIETICDNGIDDDADGDIDCDDLDCAGDPVCAPPGGGDTDPPILTNIRCMDVTPTSFTVAWDSNEPATSCTEYGPSTLYENGMICNSTLVYSHSTPLVGLTPLTEYNYRVISRDQYFNTAISANHTCTTLGDSDAPIISNIVATVIGCDIVQITWDSNEPATSQVDYGLTSSYGTETPTDFTYVTSHSVTLTGLNGDTDYHFRVRSYDIGGNGATSGDNTFHTIPCDEAPIITGLRCEDITETSMNVLWETNEPADSYVEYGETTSYEVGGEYDAADVTSHSLALSSLLPDTDYHVRAHSTDIEFYEAISSDLVCTTLPAPDCEVECQFFAFDLYIINPDMTERHMFTEWTIINDPGTGMINIAFEDKGLDFDYNDVIFNVNRINCEDVIVEVESYNADWTHEIRIILKYNGNAFDLQLWPDSHLVVGESVIFNVEDYDSLCIETGDITPPPNVSDFTATPGPGPLEITLDWTVPDVFDFAGSRICRSLTAYPTDPLTCDIIYQGIGETFVDTDVVAGVRYYYTNFAFDTSGNFASGAIADAIVPEPVSVNFVGQPEKRWPRTNNWDTTVDLEMRDPGSLIPIEEISFDTDTLGLNTVTMYNLEYGRAYDFTAKGFSHLRKKIGPLTLTSSTTTVDFTEGGTFDFYAGDCHASKDNYVNSLDISTLVNDLMSSERVSDLNDDSQVNSLDITIQLANLMQDLGDD